MTSNPTIFQQALAEGDAYDGAIEGLAATGLAGEALFAALAVEDIRLACDRLAVAFEASAGLDGRVSLEVSPRLAHDTARTLEEARRLHRLVERPNVMIKVPATPAGLPAISTLLAEGLSINVTLIFSLARYAQVMEAWLEGLERRAAAGLPLAPVTSVASFFVSRVDTKVDAAIDAAAARLPAGPARARALALRGRAAVANARLAWAAAEGAQPQRPLWASTSTKNKAYPDTLYVDELIGPDTVNTMPPATLAAFNDHGRVERSIDRDLAGARALFERLPDLGVPIHERIGELEAEGVAAFVRSYDAVLKTLEARRLALAGRAR